MTRSVVWASARDPNATVAPNPASRPSTIKAMAGPKCGLVAMAFASCRCRVIVGPDNVRVGGIILVQPKFMLVSIRLRTTLGIDAQGTFHDFRHALGRCDACRDDAHRAAVLGYAGFRAAGRAAAAAAGLRTAAGGASAGS